VFCTEDLLLIKGPGRARRRFLDLLLSQTQAGYLTLLMRYTRALRSRNALLKRPVLDPISLEGFTRELINSGAELTRLRHELVPKFSPLVSLAYRQIATDAEEFHLEYQPAIKNDFAVELAQSRVRERTYRMTLIGPHRDEVKLLLNNRSLAQFGSEGQKRTVAIALKLAQAEYVSSFHGAPPILLIDDVMGELDAKRRTAFLPILNRTRESSGQVFMTSTDQTWVQEVGREVHKWQVNSGNILAA